MKKIILAFSLAVFSIITVKAQDDMTGFHISAGIRAALPIGDFADASSFGIGIDVTPEYRLSDMVGITFTTGYTHFMGKDIDIPGFGTFEGPDAGYIPLLAGIRVYPSSNIFIGGKIGYGLMMVKDADTEGGLNYGGQVGYNAGKIQIAVDYNGLSLKPEGAPESMTNSHIALTISYNIK